LWDGKAGRTQVIWDSMAAIYSYFKPELSHESIQAMLDEHFKLDQFQHFMSYDLAIITPLDSINYQMQLFIVKTVAVIPPKKWEDYLDDT